MADGRVVLAACVAKERAIARGRVEAAIDVAKERLYSVGGIKTAVGVAPQRKPTDCCVRDTSGEAKEGLLSLRRVEPGISSVWRRSNGLRLAKRKRGKDHRR